MNESAVRYARLRDQRDWDAVQLSGLEVTADGAITLARVPGAKPGEEIARSGPFAVEPSGIAVGECGDVFLADTAHDRVIWQDGLCARRFVLPGRASAGGATALFNSPRGLVLGSADLYVADSGHARIAIFRTPTLEARATWSGGWAEPTALARDGAGRIYVLDRGSRTVQRFTSTGAVDAGYGVTLAEKPLGFIAIDDAGILFVAIEGDSAVRRFDPSGAPLPPLRGPETAFRPGALVHHGGRIYAADTTNGSIWICELASGSWIGVVRGYRGPVSAMALDGAGGFYIKPGLDEEFFRMDALGGWVGQGELTAGPLDAGEWLGWCRAKAEIEPVSRTTAELDVFVSGNAAAMPSWRPQPSLDVLLPQFASDEQPQLRDLLPTKTPAPDRVEPQRYLWVRVRLSSAEGMATPRLLQVQAETPGEDYLDYLPEVYRRQDRIMAQPASEPQDIGFLRRWLALFHAELGDLEEKLERLPREFNAATVGESALPWLASWLAFDLPPGSIEQQRERLARALALFRRRGTPAGVREMVELSTGVRPVIVERFREPRWWQLGEETSILGLNTALAPLSPQGLVVPDPAVICNPGCDPTESVDGTSDRLAVGSAVVGASGPLASAEWGEPLFTEAAHRFALFVFAPKLPRDGQETLRRTVDAERPAHTEYELCMVEPRMRVGLQSVIGIDSYVAGPPVAAPLGGGVLGLNSHLGDEPGERNASRVGRRARIGSEITLQ